jgi:hypothetical protein
LRCHVFRDISGQARDQSHSPGRVPDSAGTTDRFARLNTLLCQRSLRHASVQVGTLDHP